MYIQDYILLAIWSFIPIITAQCQQPEAPCQYYYQQLEDIPHEKLEHYSGVITFSWDNKKYPGCEVIFVTNDSLRTDSYKLPRFKDGLDPVLEEKGWHYNHNYTADGPGSMAYGIENADTLCFISYRKPATLVEPGKIVESPETTIMVQCIEKTQE